MSVFKCKMCGGTLEINNETVATCEYCGTTQTLPKLDDDRRRNLYDRANHFRRNNEFDKAEGIYEEILNEDNTDAEAYWSLVLCRYGIEYVEDLQTRKRIPTVNRAQFTSVFDDDNFKSALKYADGYQKSIYEEEAKAINEIQKGILTIAQKEEPFDVFICYKETDNNGRRTHDSVLANDLYYQLKEEGFKVFFARITLEDKLGSAYEPYIFAALNSSKAMVVLGTKPEFFNAVWVKNEWSRYLALIKQGQKKTLIPAYKDMDPYDLPEEFSHLQAQDMSKLGFMQDLIRGIKKIVKSDEPKQVVRETVITESGANVAPLIKRAYIFLEDGEWQSADEYAEKVLDLDPENAEAYLVKMMADIAVRKREELKNVKEPFDSHHQYNKVMRYANKELREELEKINRETKERIELERLNREYERALTLMKASKNEEELKKIAGIFQSISGYKNSDYLAEQCLSKAKEISNNRIFNIGIQCTKRNTIDGYQDALKYFTQIPNWKNSSDLILECQENIKEINLKAEKEHIRQKRIEKIKVIVFLSAFLLTILCVVGWYVSVNYIIPYCKYNEAIKLAQDGEYEEAMSIFYELGSYKDSRSQITYCKSGILDRDYNKALNLATNGEYEEAIDIFRELGEYKDSKNQVELIIMENPKFLEVGMSFYFGTYEQDNDTSNGKEDIEWRVLAKQDEKILLISRYALDCKAYNTKHEDATWKTCTLRKWLNDDFYNIAFSQNSKNIIIETLIKNSDNPKYNTDGGADTYDKVFLLSTDEANTYFADDEGRSCFPTEYALDKGASTLSNSKAGHCCFWLRSPGAKSTSASRVFENGNVSFIGIYVDRTDVAVRPAIWIDVEN